MAERWYGMTVTGTTICVVGIEVDEFDTQKPTVFSDDDIPVGKDEKPLRLRTVFERVVNKIETNNIECVAIGGTAASVGRISFSMLESAEVRGVVIAAAATVAKRVIVVSPDQASRNFGKRKAQEYFDDNQFWEESIDESPLEKSVRKLSRRAAFQVLAARKLNKNG